ncbi:MAG: hypothetical protein HZY73_14085 [Micropruina sp.]|nr:MAG: hypothetical protein HZY73_14085 [Micropruina sp.]
MSAPRSDDERFAELIATEFPEGVGLPDPEPEQFRTWSPAEEADEDFQPPPVVPGRPWHPLTRLGVGLVVFGLAMVLLSAFGVALHWLVAVLAGAAVFGGTALLLYRLSKLPPRDADDGGAVV